MRKLEIREKYNSFKEFYATGVLDRDVYLAHGKLHLQCYRDTIRITQLENALSPGKWCLAVALDSNDTSALDAVLTEFQYDFVALIDAVFNAPNVAADSLSFDFRPGVKARWYREASSRTFSPFSLHKLKPLTAPLKGKWTMKQVHRALANGQFENFMCNGQYSDDYAYDDASNYGRGEIKSPLSFLRRIIDSPSGWWTSHEEGSNRVTVCCHHFDNNSFTLKL